MQLLRDAKSSGTPGREFGAFLANDTFLLVFFLANAGLSILIRHSATLATVHAHVVVLGTVLLAILTRRSHYVAYAIAYICGAEVLWRMCKAAVFYETAKYALALCGIIVIGRLRRKSVPLAAAAYIVLLLPGVLIPLITMGSNPRIHKQLSFNMSGPLALAVAVILFHNLSLDRTRLWRLVILLITPVIGVGAISMFFTYTKSEEIVFTGESNELVSGGFGANQVSSTLGLGAVLLLLYLAQEDMGFKRKLIISAAFIACAMQSALTFSRNGLYAAGGAFLVATLFLLWTRETRRRITYILVGGAAVAVFVIVPYLVFLTSGAIGSRFADTKLTGRDRIVQVDLALLRKNPIYGVGAGVSTFYHPGQLPAHNELSRVMAEHGVLGLMGLLALLLTAIHRILTARSAVERAFISGMFTWSILFMLVNGFRLVAPAVAMGLAFANVDLRSVGGRLAAQQPARLTIPVAPKEIPIA